MGTETAEWTVSAEDLGNKGKASRVRVGGGQESVLGFRFQAHTLYALGSAQMEEEGRESVCRNTTESKGPTVYAKKKILWGITIIETAIYNRPLQCCLSMHWPWETCSSFAWTVVSDLFPE